MRQFGCVEVALADALLLRDAIRPLSKCEPYDPILMVRFCEKLYDAILKMKANGLESINIALEEQEALFINHFVGNEDWGNAMQVLEQSWLALYEVRNKAVYPRPAGQPSTTLGDDFTTDEFANEAQRAQRPFGRWGT